MILADETGSVKVGMRLLQCPRRGQVGVSTASGDADSQLRGLPARLLRAESDPHHRGDNGPAHGVRPFLGSLVYVHTVIRWMSNCREMETTLSLFDRSVRMAST